MGQRENQKWARYTEWTARLALALTEEREWYYDARDGDGAPVEVKACQRRKGHDDRRGTFWIERRAHRELKRNGGCYVFVLYDPENWTDGPVLDVEIKPAEWLDDLDTYRWTTTNGHHKGDEVIKPAWTAVFSPRDVPDESDRSGQSVADS